MVKSLLKDRTGIIWVGTVGGGLNKFDPRRKPFFHHGNKLVNRSNILLSRPLALKGNPLAGSVP